MATPNAKNREEDEGLSPIPAQVLHDRSRTSRFWSLRWRRYATCIFVWRRCRQPDFGAGLWENDRDRETVVASRCRSLDNAVTRIRDDRIWDEQPSTAARGGRTRPIGGR